MAHWPRIAFFVLVALLVAIPLAAPPFWVTLANYIGLYSMVALGLVLLTGVAGQTSFGQAAFVGLGAYTSAYLTIHYGASPWLTLAIGLAITAVVALFLGFITLRMKGHYLPLANEWTIFDNCGREPRLVADGARGHARVMDEALYHQIQSNRT